MMEPVGNYLSITMLPEKQNDFIIDKEPLSFATLNKISTSIDTVLKENDTIVIMDQKKISLQGELFIHIDYILLHK